MMTTPSTVLYESEVLATALFWYVGLKCPAYRLRADHSSLLVAEASVGDVGGECAKVFEFVLGCFCLVSEGAGMQVMTS